MFNFEIYFMNTSIVSFPVNNGLFAHKNYLISTILMEITQNYERHIKNKGTIAAIP